MTGRDLAKLVTARTQAEEQYRLHRLRLEELRAEQSSIVRELARKSDAELELRLSTVTACLAAWPDLVAEAAQIYATAFLAHAKAQRAHLIRDHNDAVLEVDRAMDGFTALRNAAEQFLPGDAEQREQIEAQMREKGLAAAPHRERQTQAQAEFRDLDSQCQRLLGDAIDRCDARHVQRFADKHRARVGAAA